MLEIATAMGVQAIFYACFCSMERFDAAAAAIDATVAVAAAAAIAHYAYLIVCLLRSIAVYFLHV